MNKSVLFIGAHPDDIEIGAWSALFKFKSNGWLVNILILTSESDSDVRKDEAKKAVETLSDNIKVHFMNFKDGHLVCNRDSVSELRSFLISHGIEASVIFCHSSSDSHNDHIAANQLTYASFREKIIVEYLVINSFIESTFNHNILTIVNSQIIESQEIALLKHESQKSRISIAKINSARLRYGKNLSFDRFKMVLQAGYEQSILDSLLFILDDSPVNKLLGKIIRDGVVIINGDTPFRKNRSVDEALTTIGKTGAGLLRTYASQLISNHEIIDVSSSDQNVHRFAQESSLIINGGAVSNGFCREYFDRFPGIRYSIDYDMPEYKRQRVVDRIKGRLIFAQYGLDDYGGTIVESDFGILSILKNPMAQHKLIIGCMGIHAIGTGGCFRALLDNDLSVVIFEKFEEALKHDAYGLQVLINYSGTGRPKIAKNSWHFIKY